MADPAIGFEHAFDKATYSPIPSAPSPADRVAGIEPIDAARAELASLIRQGSTQQEAGNFAEAEESFRRALEIGDRLFAPDDPDLIILINDLSRLYLRQSAFSQAEPLLLRLLELKRSKGEDHPEVATVLASLAAVRQALGMHESSEQLWRRVLDIRERTLAPNHFATASALEHLGEACAARGKIREALPAFQRALTIREKTLGSEHPSLRVARERIADLQLQASDDIFDTSAIDAVSPPERYRLLSPGDPAPMKLAVSPPPPPAPQLKVAPQPSRTTPPQSETRTTTREKKASLFIPRAVTTPAPTSDADEKPVAAETIVLPAVSVEPTPSGTDAADAQLTTATMAYREALESVREAIEQGAAAQTFADRSGALLTSIQSFVTKREVLAASGVIVLGLLGMAAATRTSGFSEIGQPSGASASIAPLGSLTPTAAANPIPVPVAAASISNGESSAKAAKPRASEERNTSKKPDKKSDPKSDQPQRVTMPALSTAVLSNLDSVAARAAAVAGRTPEAFNLQPAAATFSQRRATFDEEHGNAPQRARLIGELPTPHVPTQVMDVEGEVRVRFNVDSLGRPVLESFAVVNSPNPLLTAAVRKVIPGMRFEPARTAGPDAKPIGDVVQIGFQFSRRE